MPQRITFPVLNIYVGTSPITVGHYIQREMAHLSASDQRKVASLYIDTMPFQDTRANGLRTYGSDTMHIFIPHFQGSGSWTNEQENSMFVKNHLGVFHKPGITAVGAGGIRNNGNTAFCLWVTHIRQQIEHKLNMLNAPPPTGQEVPPPVSLRINIIAFLGGGTGSGVLPALTLLTRYILQDKHVIPQTAIYAVLPDQSKGATEAMRQRQRSNAFATLLELTALMQLRNNMPTLYLGPLVLNPSAMQVVDVIYLYGQGNLTDHTRVYQLIGMDLFMRMQDGHGAGYWRQARLPDLSGLQEHDTKGLPTFIATSGITEIIFPRGALIGAFARRAAREVLATQVSDVPVDSLNQLEKFSRDLAVRMQERLQKELEQTHLSHRPEPFDSYIIDDGDAWWSKSEERIEKYRTNLRFSRDEILRKVKDDITIQIQAETMRYRTAIFDRYIRIYRWVHQMVDFAATAVPEITPVERNHNDEDRAFNPPWFRRPNRGRFANYANDLLQCEVENINRLNQREMLIELGTWLADELEMRRQQHISFRQISAGGYSPLDHELLEWPDGPLPHPHEYTRSALPSRDLVVKLYHYLLHEAGLGKDDSLDVTRILDEVQRAQRQRSTDLSTAFLEDFFVCRFQNILQIRNTQTGQSGPQPVVDLILQFGGEDLLRQHLQWGLKWACGHLNYDKHQDSNTDGRIAREFDLALMFNWREAQIRAIINQENNRTEVQNGVTLLDSLDPDRITLLYSEYAIPVRALDKMQKTNTTDSYLTDYCSNQASWSKEGRMPPHASSWLQAQVATQKLVQLFADNPASLSMGDLYG
ncbi:MAG: tubulin-like doman-containing protein [Chloroflexales bacterium]